MAFDHENHELDPVTGFQRHKHTGHLIGIEQAPAVKHPHEGAEFPKWVAPHPNHVHRRGNHVSTPHFPEHHVDRQDNVTVLVRDAEHEAKALADPKAAEIKD